MLQFHPQDGLENLINYLLVFDKYMDSNKERAEFGIKGLKKAPQSKPYQTLLAVYKSYNYNDQERIFRKFL